MRKNVVSPRAVGVTLAIFVLALTRPLNLSPDSHYYHGAAESFRETGQFLLSSPISDANTLRLIGSNGDPMTVWPPLYPLLLSALPPQLIHALSLVVILAAAAWLAHESNLPQTVLLLAIPFASPIQVITQYVWTESVFIALTSVGLVALIKAQRHATARAWLWVGVWAVLAALTRYPGIVFIAFAAMASVLQSGDVNARLRRLAMVLAPCILFAAWLARNVALTGLPFGPRPPHADTAVALAQALASSTATIQSWVPLLALVFVAGVFTASHRRVRPAWRAAALYGGAYYVFIVATSSTTAFDPLTDRLMSPVYIPLALLVLAAGVYCRQGVRKLLSLQHASPQPAQASQQHKSATP